MITRLVFVGSAAISLLTMPSASTPSPGWGSATAAGSVHVSADRDHIVVCDSKADNLYVEAEYATSMLGTYTVADSNGAKWGCGEDSTFISRIDVFKMCTGIRGVTRSCENSVWIKRP